MGECGVCVGGTTGLISCDDPCAEKIALEIVTANATIANQNSQILTNTNNTGNEYGTEHNLTSISAGIYMNTTVRTNIQTNKFTPVFTWNNANGYTIGASHGHPSGNAPSPADASWATRNLNNAELLAANNLQYYQNNVSLTTVTSTATYMVTPQNWNSLQTKANEYDAANYTDVNGNLQNHMNDDYRSIGQGYLRTHQYATIDDAGAFALMTLFGDAINLYKAPANSMVFVPLDINTDSNNNSYLFEVPCN